MPALWESLRCWELSNKQSRHDKKVRKNLNFFCLEYARQIFAFRR
jgi:hypothetical protein